MRGHFEDQKRTSLRINFYLLFLTHRSFVDLTCFDNGLNIISAFQLQNLETDQDPGDVAQTGPICDIHAIGKDYCYKTMVGSIFGSA